MAEGVFVDVDEGDDGDGDGAADDDGGDDDDDDDDFWMWEQMWTLMLALERIFGDAFCSGRRSSQMNIRAAGGSRPGH